MKVTQQRIACKAVIAHTGKILLLREAATNPDGTNIGRWHVPGGRLDMGEKYMDGLQREIVEETGLKVRVGQPLFVGEWFPEIRGQKIQIVAIFLVCDSKLSRVKLSLEHDAYRWILPEEHVNFDIMEPEHEVIERFMELQKLQAV